MGRGEEGPILSLLLGEPAIVSGLRHSIDRIHRPAGAVTTHLQARLVLGRLCQDRGRGLLPRLGGWGMCLLAAGATRGLRWEQRDALGLREHQPRAHRSRSGTAPASAHADRLRAAPAARGVPSTSGGLVPLSDRHRETCPPGSAQSPVLAPALRRGEGLAGHGALPRFPPTRRAGRPVAMATREAGSSE